MGVVRSMLSGFYSAVPFRQNRDKRLPSMAAGSFAARGTGLFAHAGQRKVRSPQHVQTNHRIAMKENEPREGHSLACAP
jgi:hypothetical protein